MTPYQLSHAGRSCPFSDCPPPSDPRVFGMFRQASDREAVYACFTFSHWLVYANSAANPIIYNFLSGEWAGLQSDRGQQLSPGHPSLHPQYKMVGGQDRCSFLGIKAPFW